MASSTVVSREGFPGLTATSGFPRGAPSSLKAGWTLGSFSPWPLYHPCPSVAQSKGAVCVAAPLRGRQLGAFGWVWSVVWEWRGFPGLVGLQLTLGMVGLDFMPSSSGHDGL